MLLLLKSAASLAKIFFFSVWGFVHDSFIIFFDLVENAGNLLFKHKYKLLLHIFIKFMLNAEFLSQFINLVLFKDDDSLHAFVTDVDVNE